MNGRWLDFNAFETVLVDYNFWPVEQGSKCHQMDGGEIVVQKFLTFCLAWKSQAEGHHKPYRKLITGVQMIAVLTIAYKDDS